MDVLNFDSTRFILEFIDQHWLLIGIILGIANIIAKHTKTKIDDEILALLNDVRKFRRSNEQQLKAAKIRLREAEKRLNEKKED